MSPELGVLYIYIYLPYVKSWRLNYVINILNKWLTILTNVVLNKIKTYTNIQCYTQIHRQLHFYKCIQTSFVHQMAVECHKRQNQYNDRLQKYSISDGEHHLLSIRQRQELREMVTSFSWLHCLDLRFSKIKLITVSCLAMHDTGSIIRIICCPIIV